MPISRILPYAIEFFFSSRRRHTRCLSDWSSDVCSSDLMGSRVGADVDIVVVGGGIAGLYAAELLAKSGARVCLLEARDRLGGRLYTLREPGWPVVEIGRASCRERGYMAEGDGILAET